MFPTLLLNYLLLLQIFMVFILEATALHLLDLSLQELPGNSEHSAWPSLQSIASVLRAIVQRKVF